MSNSILYIVPAASSEAVNLVCTAWGVGPIFGVGTNTTGGWFDPAEYFFGNYENMPSGEEATLRAMKAGTLPEISGTWGEDGLPSEQDAITACATISIFLRDSEEMTASQHAVSVLSGMGQLEKVAPD